MATVGLSGYVESLLFGIEPTDVPAFAIATALVAAIGRTACLAPAFRATRVDPAVALRHD